MNNIKKDDALEDWEKGPTIYGVVIYNRGDGLEKTTRVQESAEALLAFISEEEASAKQIKEDALPSNETGT